MMSGKVKDLRSGAEAKASVKSTVESLIIDPKPGDLSMSRLMLPLEVVEDPPLLRGKGW